jgi:hypothetical protein
VAPSGSRGSVSSNEGALLDSVHSQAVVLMAQPHVLGHRKVSVLKAAEELAASAEALRGRLRDLVGRLEEEARDGVSNVSSGEAAAGL